MKYPREHLTYYHLLDLQIFTHILYLTSWKLIVIDDTNCDGYNLQNVKVPEDVQDAQKFVTNDTDYKVRYCVAAQDAFKAHRTPRR